MCYKPHGFKDISAMSAPTPRICFLFQMSIWVFKNDEFHLHSHSEHIFLFSLYQGQSNKFNSFFQFRLPHCWGGKLLFGIKLNLASTILIVICNRSSMPPMEFAQTSIKILIKREICQYRRIQGPKWKIKKIILL